MEEYYIAEYGSNDWMTGREFMALLDQNAMHKRFMDLVLAPGRSHIIKIATRKYKARKRRRR